MRRAVPAAAVLAAAVALTAAGCGGSGVHVQGEPHLNPGSIPKGKLLEGRVLVVELPGGEVRICGDQISDLMFGPPGCPAGPRAVGVRTDALRDHSAGPAERWGYLHLTGAYRNGTFHVISQSPRGPATRPEGSSLDRPPCPAPPGGWKLGAPTQAQRRTVERYSRLAHHHDLVDIAFFDHGSVLTVASSNPARTRAVLGRYWPRRLCVVRARYSRATVIGVGKRLLRLMRSRRSAAYGWISGAGGTGVRADGQPTTGVQVLLETPQLRALVRRLPRGLVVVEAALRPFGYA